jgi:hypothetical protein
MADGRKLPPVLKGVAHRHQSGRPRLDFDDDRGHCARPKPSLPPCRWLERPVLADDDAPRKADTGRSSVKYRG